MAISARIKHYIIAAFMVPSITSLAITEKAPILSIINAKMEDKTGILPKEQRSQIALCTPRL